MNYRYAVVTYVSDDDYAIVKRPAANGHNVVCHVMEPIFVLGEIMILDACGREVSGRQRNPDKHSVITNSFPTIEQAIAEAIEVTRTL